MKTWMKVVLGIVAVIVALVSMIFWLTGDVTKAGDDFFAAVQKNDMDAAYELLSDDFQAGTSKAQLKAYLVANAFDKVKEVSWGSRSIESNRGTLSGTVTTESGSAVPLTLSLVNGEKGWQIYAIEKQAAGFREENSTAPIPSAEEQVALVNKTVAVFVDSVNAQDMQGFYDHISYLWKQQIDVATLNEVYGGFFPHRAALQTLKQTPVVITKPAFVNDDGALEIQSRYENQYGLASFTTKYIYEGVGWKVIGLKGDLQ